MATPTDPPAKKKSPAQVGSLPNAASTDLQNAFEPPATVPRRRIDLGRDGPLPVNVSDREGTAPVEGGPSPAHPARDPLAMAPKNRPSKGAPSESRDAEKAKSDRLAKSEDPGVVEEDDGIINY